jgi:hypothetical protein
MNCAVRCTALADASYRVLSCQCMRIEELSIALAERARDEGHPQIVSGVEALSGTSVLPSVKARGPFAHGREWSRQVDADQGDDRVVREGRRSDRHRRRGRSTSGRLRRRRSSGIGTVYQEISLCPNLTVAENTYIGRGNYRLRQLEGRMNTRTAELLRLPREYRRDPPSSSRAALSRCSR